MHLNQPFLKISCAHISMKNLFCIPHAASKLIRLLISLTMILVSVSNAAEGRNEHHKHEHNHDDHNPEKQLTHQNEPEQTVHTAYEAHAAHVHGMMALSIALDKHIIEIELLSPAANLLGFEYTPSTHEEIDHATKVNDHLLEPSELFVFKGVNCQLDAAHSNLSAMLKKLESTNHQNSEHHAHRDTHNHPENSPEEDDQQKQHSDIVVNYRFNCEDTSSLKQISTRLFTSFPATKQINAMWVTNSRQGANRLTPHQFIIDIN